MKALLLALAIVLSAVIATFFLLSVLSVPKEFATAGSSLFLGAITYVHKQLDKLSKQPLKVFSKNEVVSLSGFLLPPAVVLCYAIFLIFAALEVPGVLSAMVALKAGPDMGEADFARLLTLSTIPLSIVIFYFVVRFVGIRSEPKGVWILIISVTFVISVEHGLRNLAYPKGALRLLTNNIWWVPWIQWIGGIILWNGVGLIGFWRGRKIQARRYADYLLKKIEPGTRSTILSLLRDEVEALRVKQDKGPSGMIT